MRMLISVGLVLFGVLLQAPPSLAQPGDQPQSSAAVPKSTVNLNTATLDQLETLPGIGPKVAERIVEFRQKNGGFKKIEELMNVKGIGEKSFLKLKPFITAAPAAGKASGGE